jgi:hypothetical protein
MNSGVTSHSFGRRVSRCPSSAMISSISCVRMLLQTAPDRAAPTQGKPHVACRSIAAIPLSLGHPRTTDARPFGKKVHLVAVELDTLQTQFGDRLDPIERKSDARFSSVSSFSMTVPRPTCDMASPP